MSGDRPCARVYPPGPALIVCVSSRMSSVPVRRVRSRRASWKPGLRVDDADVGHDRLGQNAGDVALGERRPESRNVIELDDAGRGRRVDGRTEIATAGAGDAVFQGDEGLVHRAVVAPVEDQDAGAAGDVARQPDREAVRVGRRQRRLPEGESEAARKLLAHPDGVLGREHERDAPARLRGEGFDDGVRSVPRHRPGVTEAQVQVAVAVDVREMRSRRFPHEDREAPGPPDHPVHRHAAEQAPLRPFEELPRPGVLGGEPVLLLREKGDQALAVEVHRCASEPRTEYHAVAEFRNRK